MTQQKTPRKTYHAPKLTAYGDVRSLTKGGLTKKGDHGTTVGYRS